MNAYLLTLLVTIYLIRPIVATSLASVAPVILLDAIATRAPEPSLRAILSAAPRGLVAAVLARPEVGPVAFPEGVNALPVGALEAALRPAAVVPAGLGALVAPVPAVVVSVTDVLQLWVIMRSDQN